MDAGRASGGNGKRRRTGVSGAAATHPHSPPTSPRPQSPAGGAPAQTQPSISHSRSDLALYQSLKVRFSPLSVTQGQI